MHALRAFLTGQTSATRANGRPAPKPIASIARGITDGPALFARFLALIDGFLAVADVPFSPDARAMRAEFGPDSTAADALEAAEARGLLRGMIEHPQHRYHPEAPRPALVVAPRSGRRRRGVQEFTLEGEWPTEASLAQRTRPFEAVSATPGLDDVFMLVSHAERLPGFADTALLLAGLSAQRFGIEHHGVLWVNNQARDLEAWLDDALLGKCKESRAFCPTRTMSVKAGEVDIQNPVCKELGFCTERRKKMRHVGREPWIYNVTQEIGFLLELWNVWQILAERGQKVRREEELVMLPPEQIAPGASAERTFVKLVLPARGRRAMPLPGGSVRDVPLDPFANPYEPLLHLVELGVLPLGWVDGWAVLFTPTAHAPLQGA